MTKLELKWLGIDFGQTMTDPRGLRNPLIFNDVMKTLGRPEEIAERMHRYRRLKEKYGSYAAVKEGHRDEILSFVFDGEREAMALFNRSERSEISWADGLEETLEDLRAQGIECDIVAELKKTLGPIGADVVTTMVRARGVDRYIGSVFSPQGVLNLADDSVDLSSKGKTKAAGDLWDHVRDVLAERGIGVEHAAVVGDKPSTDMEQPRMRGFHTIQYTGYVDLGRSEHAEYRVHSFSELRSLVRHPARA